MTDLKWDLDYRVTKLAHLLKMRAQLKADMPSSDDYVARERWSLRTEAVELMIKAAADA